MEAPDWFYQFMEDDPTRVHFFSGFRFVPNLNELEKKKEKQNIYFRR